MVEASIDGKEIIPRVKRFHPDLLIINADLQNLDPEEVCSVVKDSFQIPILLLVERNSAKTIKIDGCSADGILTKPFSKAELLQKVTHLLATFN